MIFELGPKVDVRIMPSPSERTTVQARILAYAEAIGWIGLHGAHPSALAASSPSGCPNIPPCTSLRRREMTKPKATGTPAESMSPSIQAGSAVAPTQPAQTQPSGAAASDEPSPLRVLNASEAPGAAAPGVVIRRVVRRSARTGNVSRSAAASAVKAVKTARESQIGQ